MPGKYVSVLKKPPQKIYGKGGQVIIFFQTKQPKMGKVLNRLDDWVSG